MVSGEPISTDPVGNPNATLSKHARTHVTFSSDNSLAGVSGTDLITIYPVTWFKTHTYAPTTNINYIKLINQASQTEDLWQLVSSDGTVSGVITADERWGFNDSTPTATRSVRGRTGGPTDADLLALGPIVWYDPSNVDNAGGAYPDDHPFPIGGGTGLPGERIVDRAQAADGLNNYGITLSGGFSTTGIRLYTIPAVNSSHPPTLPGISASYPQGRPVFSTKITGFSALWDVPVGVNGGVGLSAFSFFVVCRDRDDPLFWGSDYAGGSTSGNERIEITGAGGGNWQFRIIHDGGGTAFANFTDADFGTGSWVRYTMTKSGSTIRMWLNDTELAVQYSPNQAACTVGFVFGCPQRYFASGSGGNPTADAGPLADNIIFSSAVSDATREIVWGYLDTKYNDGVTYIGTYQGTGGSGTEALDHWKTEAGVIDSIVTSSIDWGLGIATPLAKLHVVADAEQLRLGYDAGSYMSVTVADGSGTTFDLAEASALFTFNDPVRLPTASRLQMQERTTPSHVANEGSLYTKDFSGITELTYFDSDGAAGSEVQITRNGVVNLGIVGTANVLAKFDGLGALANSTVIDSGTVVQFDGTGGILLSPGNTAAVISSDVDDAASAIAFDFNDTIDRIATITAGLPTAGAFTLRLRDTANSANYLEVIPGGFFGFGYNSATNAQVGRILNFLSNSSNLATIGLTGVTEMIGVNAAMVHSSTSLTVARLAGIIGMAQATVQAAANITATAISGVIGQATAGHNATGYSGRMLSGLRGRVSGVAENFTADFVTPDDQVATRVNLPRGDYDHVSGLWIDQVNNANLGTPPSNLPSILSGIRVPIHDAAYSTTAGSPAGTLVGIYGDGTTRSAGNVFPATTYFMRIPYPRRTGATAGTRHFSQLFFEPWPTDATIRAAGIVNSGDVFFDSGASFQAGLWEHDGAVLAKLAGLQRAETVTAGWTFGDADTDVFTFTGRAKLRLLGGDPLAGGGIAGTRREIAVYNDDAYLKITGDGTDTNWRKLLTSAGAITFTDDITFGDSSTDTYTFVGRAKFRLLGSEPRFNSVAGTRQEIAFFNDLPYWKLAADATDQKWLAMQGLLYTQHAIKVVENTTTPGSIVDTANGNGYNYVVAGTMRQGTTLRITMRGVIRTAGAGTNTITISTSWGGQTITMGGIDVGNGTQAGIVATFDFTCLSTGGSGSFIGHGHCLYYNSSIPRTTSILSNDDTSNSVDTTADNQFDITITWSAADAANIFRCTNLCAELLG